MSEPDVIHQILELARWAPSGDNTQPWRFERVDDLHLVVHGFDTRDHCVYDLDGHPSQISIGALLETMAIAASAHGLAMEVRRRHGTAETRPTFDIAFSADPRIEPDALIDSIKRRSVQRRPMRTRALTAAEKHALEAAVGNACTVTWLEGFDARLRTALLMFANAKLRLTMPEAYQVHRDIIQWDAQFSVDRVPDQALGIDPLTARLMRFVMHSWKRVEFFNTFLAGTWAPRVQMDLLPGLACSAHFLIVARTAPTSIDDYVEAGRSMQRFWLTATRLGLLLQPELTPLIFARYVRHGIQFSQADGLQDLAAGLAARLGTLVGPEQALRGTFMGRIGAGRVPHARSTRHSVAALMQSS